MVYLKKIKDEKSIPKYIYLDQNILIYFGQVHYGKSDSLIEETLEILFELIEKGIVKVIFNLTNVIEAQKVSNNDQLERFADFVISLTQGYAFVPFPYLEIFEVENAIRIELSRDILDIRNRAIGRGVFYLIHDGNPPKLTSSKLIPEETQKLADSSMREHFSTDDAIKQFFLNRTYQYGDAAETIKELEDIRLRGYNIKDKKFKQKLGVAQYIVSMIVEKVAIVCKAYNVYPSILRLSEGMERIMEVFLNMPLLYTYHLLLQGLDENSDHPLNSNDLLDINSYCFALPYCDMVVGEKYTISLAKRINIDEIYKTQLFNRGELDKFLETLKKLKG